MNEYVVDGLLNEARTGRRVVVAAGTTRAAHDAFGEMADRSDDALRIRRAFGRERIDFPSGGEMRFLSVRGTRQRGLSADTVFIDWDALGDDEIDHYREACLVVATSPAGKVVRA